MSKQKNILLGHGSGGQLSQQLIQDVFFKHFNNPFLNGKGDSAILEMGNTSLAFTTDSFVVDPLFFPGGDIGKLAVAGTVNDLAVAGASPKYLSASFIIEEGFSIELLEQIVITMASEALKANILIVTGDTKVVNRTKCDKLFINTSGIGTLTKSSEDISTGKYIAKGDKIIINGHIGDHGMAVMSARNQLHIKTTVESDCASLNGLIHEAMKIEGGIKFMRDATRGGLATVVSELCADKTYGIDLYESQIPVKESVRGMCELLGFDPLYVANEGKVVMVVAAHLAEKILEKLRDHIHGKHAAIIGEITESHPSKTWLHTSVGGKRTVHILAGEQLPRIC
jgi:hydrogenase expression/formation protein HypE